jgi:hypothetical protein
MITVAPYLPGKGPSFEIAADRKPTVTAVWPDGSRSPMFAGDRFRPSAGRTDLGCADDVVGFAVAYVESPEDFDRSPDDVEQTARELWEAHGESIAAEIESMRVDAGEVDPDTGNDVR